MDAVAAKICSVCGIDCSAMKRAKDANGRYICSECLERAREHDPRRDERDPEEHDGRADAVGAADDRAREGRFLARARPSTTTAMAIDRPRASDQ